MIPAGFLDAGGSQRTLAFLDSGKGTVQANSFTPVSKTVQLGDADPNRYIVVCVGMAVATALGPGAAIGQVTLGGVAMTQMGTQGAEAAIGTGLYYLKVPTGTSAALAISGSYVDNPQNIQFTVYSLTNPQNAVPTYVTTNTPTWNLGPNQFAVFGVSAWSGDSAGNISWSPLAFQNNTNETMYGSVPFYQTAGAASGNAATGTITPQASCAGSPIYGQYRAMAWI